MNMLFSRRDFLKKTGVAVAGCVVFGNATLIRALSSPIPKLDDYIEYDALGLAQLIKGKQISQAELVEVIIRRIETLDPILHFMATPAFEQARQRAGHISMDSVFAGVPILMKDMIDVGGLRRTDGSRLWITNVPKKNVAYVDGVEKAGLNILGMTNVPEFAGGKTTHNYVFGQTRNPWNLEYSPYISSGGAAAAAAAGILPMVHGTDGAGSNRLPSSIVGLLGMKPSRYRMLSGESDGGHDRAKTNQVISRTVRDSAALLNATEDKSGKYYVPVGLVEEPLKRRLKIGYITDAPGLLNVSSEVKAAQENTRQLLEGLGHKVESATYPVNANEYGEAYPIFFRGRMVPLKEMIENMTGVPVSKAGVLTNFQATFAEYAATIPDDKLEWANNFFESIPQRFETLFKRFDVLLTPVSPVVGLKLEEFHPDDAMEIEDFNVFLGHLKFVGPINFSGCPAMSVPLNWGKESGMPIGSHFIARVGHDRLLYELAYELEQARPWKDNWAPFSVKYIPV